MQLNEALDVFATHGSLVQRVRLAPMLTTSGAAAAARDSRFAAGMKLVERALREAHPDSLEMLAFAWRVTSASSMRVYRRHLVEFLSSGAIPHELNKLPTTISDPDDRRHLAAALEHVPGVWKPRYLARAIAAERDSEKARESLCRALLDSVPVLADGISMVKESLSSTSFDQLEPEIGLARRATMILNALSSTMWASEKEIEPGENFGEEVAKLASLILLQNGPIRARHFRPVCRCAPELRGSCNPITWESRRRYKDILILRSDATRLWLCQLA